MNRTQKEQAVQELQELFSGVEALLLTDTSGVEVNDINILRSKCRAEGVTLKVVKNTLARRALKGTPNELAIPLFVGPVAVAFKTGDPVTPAKLLTAFDEDNKAFELKGGILSGELLDAEGVVRLSKMKGRDELRAELLSIFKAPQREFVGICGTMVSQIVGVFAARAREMEDAA